MKGMNIIEQTPIKEFTEMSWIIFALGAVVAVGFAVTFIIKFRNEKIRKFLVGYAVGVGLMIASMFRRSETGRYTYICTFDDNVKINDISEKFNVIDHKNNIWTLEDKER